MFSDFQAFLGVNVSLHFAGNRQNSGLDVSFDFSLVVDHHGAVKPTGLQRTYPDVLTHAGVLGLQQNNTNYGATQKHEVTLAFTSMLACPLDYTPGSFHNATR